MRHTVIALALAGLAAAALPTSADARCRGCGVAAGVVGGLAAGALIGSALAGPSAGPIYVEEPPPPPPTYYYEEDGAGPICHVERRRIWVEGYGWRHRRVEVCE
ncbi:MAG: hypothetical protein ACK4UO_09010 [Pseudolabrys sp.]